MKDHVLWTTPQSGWQGSELSTVSEVRLAAWQLQWCRCMSKKFRKAEKRVVSSVWWGQGEHESEVNLEERIGLLWLDGEGVLGWGTTKTQMYERVCTFEGEHWIVCIFQSVCSTIIVFLKNVFFFFWCGPFLKSLLDLLQYCNIASVLCFGFLALRHVGS